MSIVKTDSQHYTDIANAIRNKNGSSTAYKPSEMADAIGDIQTSSNPVIQSLSVTENGTYTAPDGVDGYSPVTVDVLGAIELPERGYVIHSFNGGRPKEITYYGNPPRYEFCYNLNSYNALKKVEIINATIVEDSAFRTSTLLEELILNEGITTLEANCFYNTQKLTTLNLPSTLLTIGDYAFFYAKELTTINFNGTPSSVSSNAFKSCSAVTTINVPWAEGEVANAPWGATNATINYNYTGA